MDGWRERARREIVAIRPHWARKHGWEPRVEEEEDWIDLFVRFARGTPPESYLLRLRYQEDFETAGRREAFVNPDNPAEEGPNFWPQGGAFKMETPPKICLEGTWGFHSNLHRNRDGRIANLNKLLMEIQQCIKP